MKHKFKIIDTSSGEKLKLGEGSVMMRSIKVSCWLVFTTLSVFTLAFLIDKVLG